MGRPGGKTKTKKMAETRRTREQLKTWTVPQPSRYLKDRGVAAGADGGRKDQLVDKDFMHHCWVWKFFRAETSLSITSLREEKRS